MDIAIAPLFASSFDIHCRIVVANNYCVLGIGIVFWMLDEGQRLFP